ncbi:MAG: serine--tRNA ligase [Thermanaerothrix sp.]|jgi:seryl-tRNA synthetase|uniref:Serine--tRNA ligase n=1 Tax=Thermanaerothrix solaris TaxID=3058434 RepID=A0ABU3NPN1_9CHLR|nr:serine--tRNA ligase [Thermanaerothrix sp. 4228-RoL]MDT8898158.1 serine--tRNA ligase [Thermanaerothrix sp. 4228-RoL]
MLDLNLIREQPDIVRQALRARQMDPSPVDEVLALDARRRALLTEVEALKAERNAVSREIGRMKDPAERQAKIEAMRQVGERITALDEAVRQVETDLRNLVATLPNLPAPEVPYGTGEHDNVVIKTVGEQPRFDFTPLPHWELGPRLGILDFERGVKLSGSRFYILSGAGARLQRALIAWMLDLHIRQGYREQYPPFMVKGEVLFASGQLPKFADNLYRDIEEDLWMVPTAEVPLTGMHMDEILDEAVLPLRYTAYTPCFRREKMSAGRDVRGIKRGHQFDKVEMYIYCKPEDSMRELEKMRADAEQTCAELGLPYRVVQLCTGDLGFGAAITYDIEVWAAGCGEWLEVSSVSNVTDFQARRANIKYRPADGGKARLVHTLNGSGLGLPRTLIAVLENYQQPDGSVVVPPVLRPWMGGIEVIRPEA